MLPLVYIILLNYNNYKDTIECVKSLEKISYRNYKIVIVDNHSTDYSEKILTEMFPQYPMIQSGQNIGFSGGNNLGIRYALENGADYILLLNNDTVVDENFLDSMLMSFNRYTDAGLVGCKIMHYPEENIIWYAGGKIDWFKFSCKIYGEGRIDIGQFDEEKEVSFITGCAMLIKREVFEEVGFLTEEYFMYFEDVDFCTKVLEHQYGIIYNPNAVVYHKVSRSSGGEISPFAVKWNTRNWIIFMNKHKYKTSNIGFLCSNLYFYITRMVRYVQFIIKKDKEKAEALLQGIKEGRKFVKEKSENAID